MKLQAFGRSERGIHLKNQDAFLVDVKRGLFAVADGVTISRGDSGIASRMAIAILEKEFAGDMNTVFCDANKRIAETVKAGSTTLTAACVNGTMLDVGHVGDSRLLIVRERIEKITEDDAVKGSNVLTQTIGRKSVTPHLYHMRLKPDDILVLMTDGVAKNITEKAVFSIVKRNGVKDAPAKLIRTAREQRKLYEDDKTVVVIQVGGHYDVWEDG